MTVEPRAEFGSRSTRRLRRTGLVPGVVYGDGKDATPFQVPAADARVVLGSGAALFDLAIEGSKAVPVVVKEQQRHPVRGQLIHLDLQQVKLDVKIHADVTIELEGVEEAPGVNEGGVMEHVTREITIEALPTEIPEKIVVDVSKMEINETLQLSAVSVPEGVTFLAEEPDEVTIATLSPPKLVLEPELEEETELVGEDGEPIEREEGEGGEGEAADGEGGEAASGEGGGDDDSGGE